MKRLKFLFHFDRRGVDEAFHVADNHTVTVIEAGPCVVSQIKTAANDGYEAVQLGFCALKKGTKPQIGHFAKSGITPLRYLREIARG